MENYLPFGRTQVTTDELYSYIDIDGAIKSAARGGVTSPEERIINFVTELPALLSWLEQHGRTYPWRDTTDPWRVYTSEILLQRTRGDAVNEIYSEFFSQFPDPEALNDATEEEIRDVVHSLGFVNHRTRTLLDVGRILCEDYDGEVPDSLEELKRPWRVGDYSARACQIFSRGEPLALVDVNFARVIGRVLGYEMPQQPHKSDNVYSLLDSLVPSDPALARAFNLAILDLGALVCTTGNPECELCPINAICHFYSENRTRQ